MRLLFSKSPNEFIDHWRQFGELLPVNGDFAASVHENSASKRYFWAIKQAQDMRIAIEKSSIATLFGPVS